MDQYSNYLAAGYGLNALSSLAGAYTQSQALRAQADYQNTIAGINSDFARLQGKYAIKQGEAEASKIRQRGKQVVGTQRAAAAAQGIDVNDGTAAAQQIDTKEAVASDILTTTNNAWRAAWGFDVQAQGLLDQARMQRLGSNYEANSTLLTGGLRAVDYGIRGIGSIYGKSTPPSTSSKAGAP